MTLQILDQYSGKTLEEVLESGETLRKRWSLKRLHGWYDLVLTIDGHAGFEYRFAGHVENGRDSISDPGMGGLVGLRSGA